MQNEVQISEPINVTIAIHTSAYCKLIFYAQITNRSRKTLHLVVYTIIRKMLVLTLDKCLVLGLDLFAIQCRVDTKLLEHGVISLQQEVPIHARFLEDVTVLA